jgi:adenine deaminase
VFVSDLNKLDIRMVMKDGRVVVSDGKMVGEASGTYNDVPESLGQFCLPDLSCAKLAVPVQGHALRVIGLTEGSLLTQERVVEPKVEGSYVVADPQRDIAKVLVADRHRGQSFSVGFVHGLGIRRGAIATSVGHDSHNLCAAGMNDDDMLVAARQVAAYNGGMVVAHQGHVLASLPLPLAGLMSNRDLLEVTESLRGINVALKELGTERDVFMPLSFVQLAVIPTIRITDLGMVDVERQRFTSLWADEPCKQ